MFYTVLSTKGGVGKTTIAQQLIAPYIHNKNGDKAEIIELDNNNKSNVLSEAETQEIKSLRLHETENILLEKFMEVIAENKDVCIDVGGGDDTKAVLKALKELRLENEITFIIPVLRDLSNQKNVIDTYAMVREWNLEARIIFILNRYQNEEDFTGIIHKLQKVEDKNIDVYRLNDTLLFDEIAKEFKKPLYEITLEYIGDTKKLLVETAKSGDFNKLKEVKRWIGIYDKCVDFRKRNLDVIFKELNNG
jgi:MinD-like ATPase involved in chromosome partitioning or flagellar assembly